MSRVYGEHLASVPSMWRIGVAGGGLPTTMILDKGDALPFTDGSGGVLIVMGANCSAQRSRGRLSLGARVHAERMVSAIEATQ